MIYKQQEDGKTHLCLIINCRNLQGLMSVLLLRALTEAQWQTERPEPDADEKSPICTLTIFDLTLQLGSCKGWAVYFGRLHARAYKGISALVLVSLIYNPQETARMSYFH